MSKRWHSHLGEQKWGHQKWGYLSPQAGKWKQKHAGKQRQRQKSADSNLNRLGGTYTLESKKIKSERCQQAVNGTNKGSTHKLGSRDSQNEISRQANKANKRWYSHTDEHRSANIEYNKWEAVLTHWLTEPETIEDQQRANRTNNMLLSHPASRDRARKRSTNSKQNKWGSTHMLATRDRNRGQQAANTIIKEQTHTLASRDRARMR